MSIRCITFDCAGTLIRVDWQPAEFAADCVEKLGLPLDRPVAESVYTRLLQTRWRSYMELNLTRDPEVCDGFWKELTFDWMEQVGLDHKWFEPILTEAWEGLYGQNGLVFSLYEDTLPALSALKANGFRIAALSNWDYSLHRVAEKLGLKPYLEEIVASLEEGVEKPNPEVFRIILDRLGAIPGETLHVGDHSVDDVQGALGVGMKAVLIQRGKDPYLPVAGEGVPRISDLRQLPEVLDWIG